MSEIDQQFIEYVVKSLVSKPDAVHIDRRIDEKGVLLELTVDPEDLGRVIGKRGATAQSLRTLLRALGTKNDARYNLKIIDNGVGDQSRSSKIEDTPAQDQLSNDSVSSTTPSDDDDQDDETTETTVEEEVTVEEDDDDTADEAESEESSTSARLEQTRKELADLDDLDV
jgi:predicted RNA-binding protein YlqC (UPF0109 family)